ISSQTMQPEGPMEVEAISGRGRAVEQCGGEPRRKARDSTAQIEIVHLWKVTAGSTALESHPASRWAAPRNALRIPRRQKSARAGELVGEAACPPLRLSQPGWAGSAGPRGGRPGCSCCSWLDQLSSIGEYDLALRGVPFARRDSGALP